MTRIRRALHSMRRAPRRLWRWFVGAPQTIPPGQRDPRRIDRSEIEASFDEDVRVYLRELVDERLQSQSALVEAIDRKAYVMFGLATALIGGASIFGRLEPSRSSAAGWVSAAALITLLAVYVSMYQAYKARGWRFDLNPAGYIQNRAHDGMDVDRIKSLGLRDLIRAAASNRDGLQAKSAWLRNLQWAVAAETVAVVMVEVLTRAGV